MDTSRPALARWIPSPASKSLFIGLIIVGALTFIAGILTHNDRVWTSYLVSFFFFVSLSLGGLFFTALQHITNAGWSVAIRRIFESCTAFLPIGALGALVLVFGGRKIFSWLDPQTVAADTILQSKASYLNMSAWIIRLALFFGIWIFFAKKIVGKSIQQDQTGDQNLTISNVGYSIAFILLFALSYSFFSVDQMMSVQPHWYSTIFGIYCFAGMFQASLAFFAILLVWLMDRGLLQGYVTDHHLHDIGKYLFGFTVFYAYIAFSQFMLIWYANLPEETEFFLNRMDGGWLWVSIAIAVFRFIVPFFALLPRWAKRQHGYLVAVSILILAMQYVDIYWLVYPNFNNNEVVFSFWETLIFLGFLGAFLLMVTRFLSKHSLVPIKDPRLQESLHHEVIY